MAFFCLPVFTTYDSRNKITNKRMIIINISLVAIQIMSLNNAVVNVMYFTILYISKRKDNLEYLKAIGDSLATDDAVAHSHKTIKKDIVKENSLIPLNKLSVT